MRLIEDEFELSYGTMGAKIHLDVVALAKNPDDRKMVDLLWDTTDVGRYLVKVVNNDVILREMPDPDK